MHARPALALLCLAVLAGCTLPAGDGPGVTETVTPADVPTETAPLNWSPPVEAGDSLQAVLAAHREALNGSSFAYRNRYRGPSRGRPDENISVTVRGFVGGDRSRYLAHVEGTDRTWRQWSNGTVQVTLQGYEGGSITDVEEPRPAGRTPAVRFAHEYPFPPSETTVTEVVVTEDGYRVTASFDGGDRERATGDQWVQNGTVELVVRPNGPIERYRAAFTVRHNGTRGRAVAVKTFDTSVDALPRPQWVETALANHTG